MENLRLLIKAFVQISNMKRGVLIVAFASSFTKALRPFLNIYIPAKIVAILTSTKSRHDLLFYVALSIIANLILLVSERYFTQLLNAFGKQVCQKERSLISNSLFSIDYQLLENAEFASLVNKYIENHKSPFLHLIWLFSSWIQGVAGLSFSIIMLRPFFKVMFLRTGIGFLQSPWMSIVLIIALISSTLIIVMLSSKINRKCYYLLKKYLGLNRLFSFYTELLTNYNSGKEIRLSEQQSIIKQHATKELLVEGESIQKQSDSYRAKSNACFSLIGALLGFGVYTIIGLKASAGFFGADAIIRCIGSLLQIIEALNSLGATAGNLSGTLPWLHDYFYIAGYENSKTMHSLIPVVPFKSISFSDVSFSYSDNATYALKNVSLEIPIGKRIAIVGENGSGKTTFIKLLCGLYKVSQGRISMNGINISEYDTRKYRSLFSVVFQDFKIFSLPLAQNIASNFDFDSEKIVESLEQTGLTARVNTMHDKAESYLYRDLDSDGIEISGGEAQKIALARALYKNAPIIVLDEPTAALDPFAEQELYNDFDKLVKGKTVLFISHRLSSCFFCDKIAVFDKGELIQYGSHQELLMDINGKYYELWMAQAQYYTKGT